MFKDENRFIKFKPLAHWVSILQGLLGFFSIEIITGILGPRHHRCLMLPWRLVSHR
ncbi:unnamed protein product [Arabidopsis halleri]